MWKIKGVLISVGWIGLHECYTPYENYESCFDVFKFVVYFLHNETNKLPFHEGVMILKLLFYTL